MKLLIVITEGAHDVAFLYKLFRYGIKSTDVTAKKINEFPEPLKSLFISTFKNYEYENSNLFGRPEIPTILRHEDKNIFILLYAAGGDSKIHIWKDLIQKFQDLYYSPDLPTQLTISLSLMFDADKLGLKKRQEYLVARFSSLIPELTGIDVENNSNIISSKEFKQCCIYTFCNEDGFGNLEDIVLPLMKQDNDVMFGDAEGYLKKNIDTARPTSKKFTDNFDLNKSIIGIAGQLQFSGIANNNIIKQCDYINEEKINNHPKCEELLIVLRKLIDNL
ncbi:hypothetical protein DJ568_00715 [Mucilaginibacter hurinus]|uniref:Uncharacterized protein n=1 Tax=Mucilaginibacter hurinus TaxID=2201324 RepID=A0A367GTL0_9SPHI|nr:DUF3226 domain-containing protein [Mucilaginibacter hurinus]RCH56415.1 hypothetical protein DJ568_00715 [Mucilaginibacter hurinus]